MGRVCAVKNCHERKKVLGIKNLTVFRIPTRNNALEAWSRALAQDLTPNDGVCELHFLADSIITEDRRVLLDNTVYTSPYARKRLVQNAIPMMLVNEQHMESCSNAAISIPQCALEDGSQFLPSNIEDPMNCDDVQTNFSESAHDIQATIDSDGNIFVEDCVSAIGDNDTIDTIRKTINNISPSCSEADLDTTVASERLSSCTPRPFARNDVLEYAMGTLPENWWWTRSRKTEGSIVFVRVNPFTYSAVLRLVVSKDLSVTIFTIDGKARLDAGYKVSSIESLHSLIKETSEKTVCAGTGIVEESYHQHCEGFVAPNKHGKFIRIPRCHYCHSLRRTLQNRINRRKCTLKARLVKSQRVSRSHRVARERWRRKVQNLRTEILQSRKKCALTKKQVLNDVLSELPSAQREAVTSCMNAAKTCRVNDRRYTLNWVYECLHMRIKSGKLYEHLRKRNVLPLPSKDTLNRYIKKLDTSCGFQKPVFECMRLKSASMAPADKRGAILVDEVALSEAVNLDRSTMKFNGFVDLGDHTPNELRNVRADHALVFMFQPFRGVWIQVLGCFLSRNSVTSVVLHKLLIECLLQIERAGFNVDVIAMDGAQWNRGVWKLEGVLDKQVSCEHPCDSTRRLWMVSDFPHLIKNFRTGIFNVKEFETPDGIVKIDHFWALIAYEGHTKPNMSIAYKLTPAHIAPKGYQKMNVPLAFQVFSDQVRVAMEVYREDPRCPRLKDSAPTIQLIARVGNLINAMMSRKPMNALRPVDTCRQKKAIEDFLVFLDDWREMTKGKGKGSSFPISTSTFTGLKVTLRSTLELVQFLHEKYEFKYLMTTRLNQDALERFFGMMRNACGSNDHPDPLLFIQVYRLLCTYSLVKPPRGSNVSGTELLQTLMQTKESLKAQEAPKQELFAQLDAAIDRVRSADPIEYSTTIAVTQDHLYTETSAPSQTNHLSSHDYDVVTTSEKILSYVAGYTARQMKRVTRCPDCVKRLISTDSCERDQVIDVMNRYNGLTYPSEELFKLIQSLEHTFLEVVGTLSIKENTLHQIVERVSKIENFTLVGCLVHEQEITKKVTTFYLVMRAHFLTKSVNENFNSKKIKAKMHRKNSKL